MSEIITDNQIDFIISSLEESISWSDYVDEYFANKHNLDVDKSNVRKSIDILEELKTFLINKD